MGCVFQANNNIKLKNEISLTPLPYTSLRKIKTDSYPIGLEETNNSKRVHNNNHERINNLFSINNIPIKVQLKSGKEVDVLPYHLDKLYSAIKGFLFRKKYDDYLKTQLMDYTNELYFEFIILTKNYKSSKILNDKKNDKLKNIFKTSWEELYIKDPTIILKENINKIKKYQNGLIFKYKNKYFDSSNINQCLQNAISCYKGSVDIITNKKNGNGELINIDGTQQIGTFYNDEFCGWNILVKNNGIIYIGLFNNNILTGKGILYNSLNGYLYKGDFNNFQKDGYGEEICEQYKYKGEFDHDKKYGRGEMILNNKDIYKGKFLNDKFNGNGYYIWFGKNKEYFGDFVDDKMQGNGFLKWGKGMYYKGMFNNGIKEGKGEFGYINGHKFFFTFKNDLPNEKGYMLDKNNKIYEVMHNQRKIFDKNKKELFIFE